MTTYASARPTHAQNSVKLGQILCPLFDVYALSVHQVTAEHDATGRLLLTGHLAHRFRRLSHEQPANGFHQMHRHPSLEQICRRMLCHAKLNAFPVSRAWWFFGVRSTIALLIGNGLFSKGWLAQACRGGAVINVPH